MTGDGVNGALALNTANVNLKGSISEFTIVFAARTNGFYFNFRLGVLLPCA